MINRIWALISRKQAGKSIPGPDSPPAHSPTSDPNRADVAVLIARGDGLADSGNFEEAAACFRQAIAIDTANVAANCGLGRVLKEQGQFAEAEATLKYAISLAPAVGEMRYLLGAVLQQQGKFDDAIREFKEALQLQPNLAIAYRELCLAHFQCGQIAYAKEVVRKGIALFPNFAELHFYRGNLYVEEGDAASAVPCFERAISIAPEIAAFHFNLAVALQDLNLPEKAEKSYRRAIELEPGHADAHNNLGSVQIILKQFDEALASFNRALDHRPDSLSFLGNRGHTLRSLGRPEDALIDFDAVLLRDPQNAEVLNNRAAALQVLRRHQEALDGYAQSIKSSPNYSTAHLNEGMCRLQMGDFLRGWQKYEWRKDLPNYLQEYRGNRQMPVWLGKESLVGKVILLQAEQGIGDTIQFCRYATAVAKLGAKVILQVQAPLKSVLANFAEGIEVVARGEPLPPFDFHCPLLSLPLALNTSLDNIPSDIPYLHADAAKIAEWREKLGSSTTRPRIGLVWSGSAGHLSDRDRSIPLGQFSRMILNDADFVCLQNEVRSADQAVMGARRDILFFGDELKDFADTAALVELLDVVVSVDTSVAHLAGALGKPVWLLLPFSPDFRWLLDRTDSPWYPTATLFRQSRMGDWDSVLEPVRDALAQLIADHPKKIPVPNA